jgi:hypothetical protein
MAPPFDSRPRKSPPVTLTTGPDVRSAAYRAIAAAKKISLSIPNRIMSIPFNVQNTHDDHHPPEWLVNNR